MPKQIALDKSTYDRLVGLSGELTVITRKNITLGMTASCAISLLETVLRTPIIERHFKESIKVSDLKSSEEFVGVWKWVATKSLGEKGPKL